MINVHVLWWFCINSFKIAAATSKTYKIIVHFVENQNVVLFISEMFLPILLSVWKARQYLFPSLLKCLKTNAQRNSASGSCGADDVTPVTGSLSGFAVRRLVGLHHVICAPSVCSLEDFRDASPLSTPESNLKQFGCFNFVCLFVLRLITQNAMHVY